MDPYPREPDPGRRLLLRGLVVAGVAGYVGGAPAAMADRLLVLVDDSPAAAAFARGVAAAVGQDSIDLIHARLDAGVLGSLARELSHSRRRIVGLVDDAFGILLVDAARGTGARLGWQAGLALAPGAEARAAALGRRIASGAAPVELVARLIRTQSPTSRRHFAFVIEPRQEHAHGRT